MRDHKAPGTLGRLALLPQDDVARAVLEHVSALVHVASLRDLLQLVHRVVLRDDGHTAVLLLDAEGGPRNFLKET